MFSIATPSRRMMLKLQSRENAYYWSRCAENFLRKHGLIGIANPRFLRKQIGFPIVTRSAHFQGRSTGGFFEGPLSATTAASLGISTSDFNIETLELLKPNGETIGHAAYPEFTVRRIPKERGEVSEPYLYKANDPYWNNRLIRCSELVATKEWKPLAYARDGSNDALKAVLISDGKRLVSGVPLLDLIAYSHASAPLDVGFYTIPDKREPFEIEDWLIEQLIEHVLNSGSPVVRAARWPNSFNSAMTVRHDYDRPIDDSSLRDLLDFYELHGIKSTWGFLPGKSVAEHVPELVKRGHEVILHTTAGNLATFRDEMSQFHTATGLQTQGYTAHGGIPADGWLGESQFEFARRCRLLYGEMLDKKNGLPHCANVSAGGIPETRPLMLPPFHASLDTGMRPDAHNLELLLEDLPARIQKGLHLVPMNHPDIHVNELKQLIASLDLSQTWRATINDVLNWSRAFKFQSRITTSGTRWRIGFGDSLQRDSTLILTRPNRESTDISCPAGTQQLTLETTQPIRYAA